MRDERLKNLLGKLADFTSEPVREGLGLDITEQIPKRLVRHRVTWHSFNILIDLSLSRSAAAAAIIIAVSLWASLLGAWGTSPNEVLQDSRLLIKYGWAGENAGRDNVLASLEDFYIRLACQGKDVTYYGKNADPDDCYAIMMYWKLPDGKYRVIFNDLTTRVVSPETVITLQTYMLRKHIEQ